MKMYRSVAQTVLLAQYIKITAVVALYWFVSISTVFINKTLLNSEKFNLNAPLFITWTQSITSVVICQLLNLLSQIFPASFTFPTPSPFKYQTLSNVLPLTLLFVITISFSNLCLTYVGVSFYFVSRSLTTVFNVIFTYLILKQTTSSRALSFCFLIVIGFILGVDQESFVGTFSLKGTVYGVLGSLALSLYSINTKKVLNAVNQQVLLLSYYNNLYSIFIYIPLIYLTGEYETLKSFDLTNSSFWVLTLISGVFGFLIGFVTTLQIQVTSPLTHNISGTAKACAQTVIATYSYGEVKPNLWWFSNFVVLFGSAGYARVKQLELAEKIYNKGVLPTVVKH